MQPGAEEYYGLFLRQRSGTGNPHRREYEYGFPERHLSNNGDGRNPCCHCDHRG